jgi:hypothetical protein
MFALDSCRQLHMPRRDVLIERHRSKLVIILRARMSGQYLIEPVLSSISIRSHQDLNPYEYRPIRSLRRLIVAGAQPSKCLFTVSYLGQLPALGSLSHRLKMTITVSPP